MTKYGYIRQGIPYATSKQFHLVNSYAYDELLIEVEELIVDKELIHLLNKITEEDVIIFVSLQAIGKTIQELDPILTLIQEKKTRLICITEGIDTKKDPSFFEYFKLISTYDKHIRSRVARQSIMKKDQKIVALGRPSIDEETVRKVHQLYEKRKTMRDIARECGISLGTAHKYASKYKQKKESE